MNFNVLLVFLQSDKENWVYDIYIGQLDPEELTARRRAQATGALALITDDSKKPAAEFALEQMGGPHKLLQRYNK